MAQTGDADFQGAGIGQIHDVRLEAHAVCKRLFAASAQMVMAGFWLHDAHVAGGFGFETLEAMALGIRFWGFAATGHAVNIARPFQFDFLSQHKRLIDRGLVEDELVFNLGRWRGIGIAGQWR